MSTHNTQLVLSIEGKIVDSNFEAFATEVRAVLASLNTSPETDEEFAEADAAAKDLKKAEDALRDAKERAMQEAGAIYALFERVDALQEECRQSRLTLSKAVTARKEELRQTIVREAVSRIGDDWYSDRISNATKGKRSLETMRDAAMAECELILGQRARAKQMLDETTASNEFGEAIQFGLDDLMRMQPEQLHSELMRRTAKLRAEAEAREKARLAKEERERLEKEGAERHEEKKAGGITMVPGPVRPKADAAPPAQEKATGEPLNLAGYVEAVKAALGPLKGLAVQEEIVHAVDKFRSAVNAAFKELVSSAAPAAPKAEPEERDYLAEVRAGMEEWDWTEEEILAVVEASELVDETPAFLDEVPARVLRAITRDFSGVQAVVDQIRADKAGS